MKVSFRTMTLHELGAVLDWAAAEGWNPGLDDAPAFRAADPEGFFVAIRNKAPVAAISVVNHNPDFAFLGLYISRPDCRGQGIGYALWQTALAHAAGRTVGLDGVPDQQANYARSGFDRAGSTVRYTGVLPRGDPAGIRAADPAEISGLIDLEARVSGAAKPAFLDRWFKGTRTRKTFVATGGGDDGAPDALVTVRACRAGYKIGPLIAHSSDRARTLLHAAADITGAEPVSIDVAGSDEALTAICRDAGFTPGFETARMYRGAAPRRGAGLYAPATLELG